MKKTLNKRKFALATSSLLLAATVAGGTMALPASAASYDHTYTADLTKAFQEFDGWGLSLSWWATEIGDWTRMGASGLTKREEVMEALYGESGLNLNIARYNVGGGDNPAHTHMTDDRNTPGWKGATAVELGEDEDAPEGTFTTVTGASKGTVYKPDEKYVFTDAEGNTLSWQDTPDWRQLWVLDWIQSRRTEDLLTEYYSNSPPYWLTRSGCSSGDTEVTKKNNRDEDVTDLSKNFGNLTNDTEHNQAFVDYLLDVYEYLVGQGFTFENIQPFNESNNAYWYWKENGDQEGCHFSSEQQVEITRLLAKSMKERSFEQKYGAVYNWGDETNTNEAWSAYQKGRRINSSVVDGASRLTYHIYSYAADTAQKMYRVSQQHDQEIYMSEICYTEGSKYDPSAMTTGFDYTQGILNTVKNSGADAYVFWQGVEDMVGQMKSGTNYGLIQGVYYTQEEASSQGIDIAALGYNFQDYVCSKAYYMSGQFTKYIHKGYTIIDVDDSGSLAAISPDGKTLVVVKQNNSTSTDSFKLNLNGFQAETVEKIVTDQTHDWAKSAVSTDGTSIVDTVSASSVTTYVIQGNRTGDEGYYIDDSRAVKMDSLNDIKTAIAAADTEDTSKAYMYATYDVVNDNGGDFGYFGTTSNQQKEAWMAVKFYGVGFGLTLPQKNDAGSVSVWVDSDPSGTATAKINLRKSSTTLKGIVYSEEDLTGFGKGWHTVYVRAENGGWVNFDGIFIKSQEGVVDESNVLTIKQASGLGNRITFSYEKIGFMGYEIYAEYRTVGGDWVRSKQPFAELTGSIEVSNADSVQLRLVAVKGDDVKYSPALAVSVLAVKEGVLYFVDCGTASEGELSTGAVLGTAQSASDKAYGKDEVTGLSWGYTNGIKTAYNGTEDAMTSVMSLDETGDTALGYKFTLPQAGQYNLALGFYGGGKDWGTRALKVAVTGATVANTTDEVTLVGGSYTAWYSVITTAEANAEITVSLTKVSGDNPMVSLIVITDTNTAIPLYTSGASNYNSASVTVGKQVSIGDDLIAEVEKTSVSVYLSNGEKKTVSASGALVSYTVDAPQIVAGQDAKAIFTSTEYPGLEIYSTYTWHQEGAMVLYYNIDCAYIGSGTPPDDAAGLIGSKQSTTHDQVYGVDPVTGNSWGYTSAAGDVSYENNQTNSWSIRGNVDNLTYKMTGFAKNEHLQIMTGGHLYSGWGVRAYNVVCNNEIVGNISFPGDDQNDSSTHIYETFTCTANEAGELEVKFSKSSGDKPWVGYIKIWSAGGDATKADTIVSDKTTVARDGSVTLKNLVVGATVYVLDENNALLGNFEAKAETQTVKVSDYLPDGSFTLCFTQAKAGDENSQLGISEELIISVPGVTYSIENEYVKDGEELVIQFYPHAEKGLTSLTVTPPGGVPYDLTEGFFYRAKCNGDHIVTIVVNGIASKQVIKINNFADFNAVYNTETWTKDDVTITLAPQTISKLTAVLVNGEELTANAEGKYVITATQNGTFDVKLLTEAGYEYEKQFVVANIDKSEPDITLSFNFSVSAGISFDYSSLCVSGGALYVSRNGGAAEQVSDSSNLSIGLAGKYEFTYVNEAGNSVVAGVYYVTYGLEEANLAKVTLGEDGKVNVTAIQREGIVARLYRAGEDKEIASMKATREGKYYLEIENGSESEIIVFNVDPQKAGEIAGVITGIDTTPTPTVVTAPSIGGMVLMIIGIVLGSAALVLAAVVCPILILQGRKKS